MSSAAVGSSPSKTTTTLTVEEAEKLLQEAGPLFINSKYSEAIDLYSKVVDGISLNEADASLKQILSRALSNRSGCFLGLKKLTEALQDARKCVDIRPSWVRSHLRVAIAAEELEQFDLAISSYESAIKAKDRSGAAVPSKIEFVSKILGISWMTKKPKSETHSFLSNVVIASGISEADANYLFSFFDQPIAQFFDISREDVVSLGFDHKKVNKIIAVRDKLERVGWKKITFFENEEKAASATSSGGGGGGSKTAKLVTEFCELLTEFVSKNSESSRHASAAYHAYLWISKWVKTPDTVACFTESLAETIEANKANCKIFGTVEVKQALLEMSPVVDSDVAALRFYKVFVNLVQSPENLTRENRYIQKLYGAADIRDLLISFSKFVCSTSSANQWCGIVLCIGTVEMDEIRKIWGTQEMLDALLFVLKFMNGGRKHEIDIKYCGCGTYCRIWMYIVHNLVTTDSAIAKLFAVNKIRDVMLSFTRSIRTVACRYFFCRILIALSTENPKLFCVAGTAEAIDFIGSMFVRACGYLRSREGRAGVPPDCECISMTHESVYYYLQLIKMMLELDKELLQSCDIGEIGGTLKSVLYDRELPKKFAEAFDAPESLDAVRTKGFDENGDSKANTEGKEKMKRELLAKSKQLISDIEKILS